MNGPRPATDFPNTITAGGTAQDIVLRNPNRQYFEFQNTSDTDMWVCWTGRTASAGGRGSICFPGSSSAGRFFEQPGFVPEARISVFCATTGKTFTAIES